MTHESPPAGGADWTIHYRCNSLRIAWEITVFTRSHTYDYPHSTLGRTIVVLTTRSYFIDGCTAASIVAAIPLGPRAAVHLPRPTMSERTWRWTG